MKKKIFLFLSFLIAIFASSQNNLPEFGKIDKADLELKACPFERDAPAMKLFDVQETEFDLYLHGGARLKTTTRVRIKVFNEKGYKYANIRIPYFSKKGVAKIKQLNGAIYNLGADGNIMIQDLDEEDFFKEKAIENIDFVNFTFPNLKPGSVIEYSYVTIENNLISLPPWLIQDEIPVLYTSRIITTPADSKIFERVFGDDSIRQSFFLLKYDQYRTTTYFKENIPSFKAEPYMSSMNDQLLRVSFLLFPRGAPSFLFNKSTSALVWQATGKQFINSTFFKEQVLKQIPGTEKITDSAKTIVSVEQRIGYIYNEVKKRIPGGKEQTIKADNLAEAWENKTGTSAEVNLILLNLLNQAKINCLPLLVSTRENGKINKDFPSFGQINGVDVVAFDSLKFYILDASLKFQSFQNPPINILNREAYLLSQDSMQWVTVTDTRPLLKQSVHIQADLNENGKMEGTGTIQYYDYAKAYKLDTTLKDKSKNEEFFFDKNPLGLKIISSSKENTNDDSDPLFETIEFVYEPMKTDDFYFINPQILTERNKNPFLADNRSTDIDLGCNQLFVLTMQIGFPESYLVEHLPKNTTLRTPDSSFFYKITYSSESQNVYIYQLYEIKRAIYSKEEYPGVKDFFKQMFALMAEEIILKKKK